MPKLVNYAARFEFLRRAAFAVVRDDGPHALSRRSVAAALDTSVNSVRRAVAEDADLRQLALDEVERRRARGRWGRPGGLAGAELAVFLLRRLLPDEEPRRAEELVWLRLVVSAHRFVAPEGDTVADLRDEHALADRGYVPERAEPLLPQPADRPAADGPDPLADHWHERDQLVARVVAQALAAVGVEGAAEHDHTRAVVDGLLLSTALGRTTPAQAVATLQHHVAALEAAARVTA